MNNNKKRIRIQKDLLIDRIKNQYGSMQQASIKMGRSHDFLGWKFRIYNIEFPENLLIEIWQKLGIDYRDLGKRNKQKCADDQLRIDDFENLFTEDDWADLATTRIPELTISAPDPAKNQFDRLIKAIEELNERINQITIKEWRITIS